MSRPSATRELATALAIYVLLAVAVSWPLARDFATRVIGDVEFDQRHAIWILWHYKEALLGRQDWFTADLLYYPHGAPTLVDGVGPLSGFLALPFWPWGPVAAYNGALLLGLALSGWCMYLLARYGAGSPAAGAPGSRGSEGLPHTAALFAGVVFVMWPSHLVSVYGHLEKVFVGLLPLNVLAGLLAYDPARSRRWVIAPAVTLLLILLQNGNQFLFALLALVLLAGTGLATHGRHAWRPFALRVMVSGAIAIAITAPLLIAMAGVARDPNLFVALSQYSAFYSPDLLHLLLPSIHQAAFGPFVYPPIAPDFAGQSTIEALSATEGWSGSGIETAVTLPVTCLALAAAAATGRCRGVGRWLLLGGAFALLALGPSLRVAGTTTVTLPYAWLLKVPGFDVMRTPGRFMMIASVGFAMAAAFGLSHAMTRVRLRMVPVLVTVLVLIECWPRPWPQQVPIPVPAFYTRIAEDADAYAVLDLPSGAPIGGPEWPSHASAYQYYQITHRKPIAWGYLSRPFVTFPVSNLLGVLDPRAPDPTGTRARLAALGYRYVVWHKHHAELFANRRPEVVGEGRPRQPASDARTSAFLIHAFAGEQPIADDDLVTVFRLDPPRS